MKVRPMFVSVSLIKCSKGKWIGKQPTGACAWRQDKTRPEDKRQNTPADKLTATRQHQPAPMGLRPHRRPHRCGRASTSLARLYFFLQSFMPKDCLSSAHMSACASGEHSVETASQRVNAAVTASCLSLQVTQQVHF